MFQSIALKLLGVAILIAILIGGWFSIVTLKNERDAVQVKLSTANTTIDGQNKSLKLNASSANAVIKTVIQTQTHYQTVEKEVIRYVTSTPARCNLSADWVRQYNSAIGASVPAATVPHGAVAASGTIGIPG